MAMIGRLSHRYISEVGWCGITFVACAFALAPTMIVGFGYYAPIFYVYAFILGAIEILLFSLLSSLIDHFVWKATTYALAVAGNIYVFFETIQFDGAGGPSNITGLVIVQLLFTFPIFYLLVRRDRPASFWRMLPTIEDAVAPPKTKGPAEASPSNSVAD